MFDVLHAVLDRATEVGGPRSVSYALLRGRRVLRVGVCPLDGLSSEGGRTMRVALASPMNYCQRVTLEVFRHALVPFVARRHLEQEAVFSDRFRLRTEVQSLRDGKADVWVLACSEEEAEVVMEGLPVNRRPLTHLVLAESAVAALLARATTAPVLVVWLHRGLLSCLVVSAGRVLWQRSQRVDTAQFLRSDDWRAVVERAAAAAPPEFATAPRIQLGDGPWRESDGWAVNGSRFLVEAIGKQFSGVAPEAVLAAPELFGLHFLPSSVNLLMNGYAQRVSAWRWAVPTAAATAVAGVTLGSIGLVTSLEAERLSRQLAATAAPLPARHAEVQASLPSAKAIAEMQKVLNINDELVSNVRVDHLLARLVRLLPAGVRLKRLEVVRARGSSDGPRAKGSSSAAQPMQYHVNVELTIRGGYSASVPQAELLVARLAELGSLEGTRFTHAHDQSRSGSPPVAAFSTRIVLNRAAYGPTAGGS